MTSHEKVLADPSEPHVLRDYAFIADGERGALIGPKGDIQWLCFPSWESPSIFSTLQRAAGSFTVQPTERFVWGGFYEEGSLIWRSRWAADGGLAECREALAFPGNRERTVILRQLRGLESEVPMRFTLHPVAEYGHAGVSDWKKSNGLWTATAGDVHLRVSGVPDARVRSDDTGDFLLFEVTLKPGDVVDTMVELSSKPFDDEPPRIDETWAATESAWRNSMPNLRGLPAERDSLHAYAILLGMTSQSGAMVASATMGLPERMHRGGSYDYRYAWIRDQAITGQALATLGPDPLLQRQVRWVVERVLAEGAELKPAYAVDGSDIPSERSVDMPGYPGGADVAGNWVGTHFQLDMSGDLLLLLSHAARLDCLDVEGWDAITVITDAIEQRHTEPDNGVWELEPKMWAHSRLMCAAGLRAIASVPNVSGRSAGWLSLADTLVANVGATSVHRSGRWQCAPDVDGLDSSLLVPGLRGAVAFDDPRNLATIRAVEDLLVEDGYVYRNREEGHALGQDEGAFLLCGFWLSLAKHRQGDHGAAAQLFERNRAACGPPAILAEEFDVQQRQLRGNLPQAFVHALLLETAVTGARTSGTWSV